MQLLCGPLKETWAIVDDQKDLVGWFGLPLHRGDRLDQVVPALFGVGADDDRDRGLGQVLFETECGNGGTRDPGPVRAEQGTTCGGIGAVLVDLRRSWLRVDSPRRGS